jgi:hypothetical protein
MAGFEVSTEVYDCVSQEAAWQAVVKVSGVDFSFKHP